MPVENNVISDANFGTVINQINTNPPATPQNYAFDTNLAISGNVVVPAKLILEPIDGARFVAANSTSTITFEGVGLGEDCLLGRQAVFSGFARGKVRWTGADYPLRISERLFDASSVSQRIQIALDAFKHSADWKQNKVVTIQCYSGNIDTSVIVRRYASLFIPAGVRLTNTFNTYAWVSSTASISPIQLEGDNFIYGEGATSVIEGSNTVSSGFEQAAMLIGPATNEGFVLSSEYSSSGQYYRELQNVFIEDLFFQGPNTRGDNQAVPAVSLGACTNGHIRRCTFDNWAGYSANIGQTLHLGGTYTSGIARDCSITDCVFTRTGYHVGAVINGRNCKITRNIASRMGNVRHDCGTVTATTSATSVTVSSMPNHTLILAPWAVFTRTETATSKKTIWRTHCTINSATSISLASAIPSGIASATGFTVTLELTAQGGHCFDVEPNAAADVVDAIEITDNIFDASDAKTEYLYGIYVQGAGTAMGARTCSIRNNKIISTYPKDAGSYENPVWLGSRGAMITYGIETMDSEGVEIDNNLIQYPVNAGLWLGWHPDDNKTSCYNLRVTNNQIVNPISVIPRTATVIINDVYDSVFENNRIVHWNGFSSVSEVWENLGSGELPTARTEMGRVSISGANVTLISGSIFRWYLKGKTFKIGSHSYVIQSVSDTGHLTLTTTPSEQGNNTGAGFAYTIVGSNNKYRNNDWTVSLASSSTSEVLEYGGGSALASAGYFQMTNTETSPLSLPNDTLVTVPIGTLTGNVTTYSIANNKFAVNEEGIYSLSGGIRLSGTTGGGRSSLLLRRVEPTGGEPIVVENEQNISDGAVMDIVFNFTFTSNGAQEFYLELYQNSGAARTAFRVTSFSGHFRLVKIGEA
ncbi:MAG TPA: hypothetical protein VF596_06320 [Pyrinomonadaceae bacterium]|jgi:hypothetical protein